jgi:thiamine biosynthesis protein ThiI
LVRKIKNALKKQNVPVEVRTERGRIYLMTPEMLKSMTIVPRIFGIVSFSPATQTTAHLQEISQVALQLTQDTLDQRKSFAIRATRVGTHSFTSQEVAIHIGNEIVQATHARVDLNKPDFELYIEIRDHKAFLFTEKQKGVGGLPLGTQGTILALINNPASLLAAWYLMRRGCNVVLTTQHRSTEEAIQLFLSTWYADSEIVPLDTPPTMIPQRLSEIALEKKCDAIATDHAFEDLSENISDLATLKKHNVVPILSPLISLTKKEIEQQCKKRGIPL